VVGGSKGAGLEVARADLAMRGAGSILGYEQSGDSDNIGEGVWRKRGGDDSERGAGVIAGGSWWWWDWWC
jgi:hypothetical protein